MSASSSSSHLESLYAIKVKKLEEQKALSDKMHELLVKLNEENRLTRKSLLTAIAVSKQPGYFEYYVVPPELKEAEERKVLNSLARSIQKSHVELEAINTEISQATPKPLTMSDVPISSISQWFEMYGRPKGNPNTSKDLLTAFVPSPKIYGGTAHHRSFKTSSSTMRKGRLTR